MRREEKRRDDSTHQIGSVHIITPLTTLCYPSYVNSGTSLLSTLHDTSYILYHQHTMSISLTPLSPLFSSVACFFFCSFALHFLSFPYFLSFLFFSFLFLDLNSILFLSSAPRSAIAPTLSLLRYLS